MKEYYVYILASKRNGTLYIGITSNLSKRVWEHKNNLVKGFTSKYDVHNLVYFEAFSQSEDAISREKQLKWWKSGKAAAKSVKRAIEKMKAGSLKSGRTGVTVKSRKQAVAIGLSQARKKRGKSSLYPDVSLISRFFCSQLGKRLSMG